MSYFNSIIQNVVADPLNAYSSNLYSGQTWSGTSSSTLNISGIQISLKTDKNCYVYVQQSPDGLNWNISDRFIYDKVENNFGITVQAINSYYRILVTNLENTSTTIFRLQTALCPIVEVVPRNLDENGHLQTAVHIIKDQYGWDAENTPSGEMRTITPSHLIGSIFTGYILDPNFWNSGITSGGTIEISGQTILSTNTGNFGGAFIQSFRSAEYKPGAANRFRTQMRLEAIPHNENCYRRWGVYNITDGAFFEISGATFNVVIRKSRIDTKISINNFNKNSLIPDYVKVNVYEIYWNNAILIFSINDNAIHLYEANNTTWTDTTTLPIKFEIQNLSGATTNHQMFIRSASVYRLGSLEGNPIWFHGTTAISKQLKYGAGKLHKITLNNPTGTLISIYDSIGTASNTIAIISAPSQANPVTLYYDLSFYNGLYIVTTGTWDYTCIYE